jgi:predicted RecA/RadA family phage recombinase
VNPQNQAKLRRAIAAAGGAAIAKNGYVTAIDVLVGVGWLPPAKVEDWRRGRVPYLERVTVASLPKISTAMKVFRSWAKDAGLRPSETVYVSWTRAVGVSGSRSRVTRTSSGSTEPTGCRRSPTAEPGGGQESAPG